LCLGLELLASSMAHHCAPPAHAHRGERREAFGGESAQPGRRVEDHEQAKPKCDHYHHQPDTDANGWRQLPHALMGDMDDDHADHGCCQGIESRRSKARGGVQPDSQSQREDRRNDAGDVEGPMVVPGEVADVVASLILSAADKPQPAGRSGARQSAPGLYRRAGRTCRECPRVNRASVDRRIPPQAAVSSPLRPRSCMPSWTSTSRLTKRSRGRARPRCRRCHRLNAEVPCLG
jgi:hypothetical protein